jgi:hypothetical protein
MTVTINKQGIKTAIISTIIAGLAMHMYALTNNFLTFDSMWNLYSTQDMIASGRPFLQYACLPTSYYDLTWINGLVALVYLSFSSAILVDLFEIKNKYAIILLSICVVGFPSMASLFCYSFTMDGYALAILLAILSVWLSVKYKHGFLLGALSLGISMGIYQAYLSLGILLCLFVLVFDMENKSWKELVIRVVKMLIMGILSFAFYRVSLQVFLKIKEETLSGYQGTNEVLELNINHLLLGVKNAYINFIDFARYGGVLTPNSIAKITLLLIVLFSGIIFVYYLFLVWKKQNIWRVIFLLIILGLIPAAVSTIAIISSNTFFHILLRYPWMLFFVFSIALTERKYKEKEKRKIFVATQLGLLVLIFVLMFNYAVTANVVYSNMNERYEKTYATTLRILMRIEETEGYTQDTKVAILGGGLAPEYFELEEQSYDITKNYFGATGVLCVNDTDKISTFMKHYHNKELNTIDLSKEIELTKTEEYKKMGKFPETSSIGWIDGILVVKLNG